MASHTTYREQLGLFFQYLADVTSESDDVANDALRDAGLDPEGVGSCGQGGCWAWGGAVKVRGAGSKKIA